MTFDVTFDLDPMTLEVGFGELYDVSDGEADRIYQDGYDAGKTDGYAEGEADGYESGKTDGKVEGYSEGHAAGVVDGYSKGYEAGGADGYAKGEAAEQAVTDGILTRSISGAYRNDRATSIGSYAFRDCTDLTAVDFPLATSIGNYAFGGCKNLKKLVLRNKTVCTLSSVTAFMSTPIKSGTGYIYVPDDLVDSYKAATNWSTYAAQIKPLSELEE